MSWKNREVKFAQLEPEWFQARMGCLTGSIVGDIMKGARGGYAKARETLLYKKAIEYMSGVDESEPIPQKFADWGHDHEPDAIDCINVDKGVDLKSVGLIKSDFNNLVASSVDGITEDGSLVAEAKCPFYMHSHIKQIYHKPAIKLYSDAMYKKYYWQVRHHMLCTGAKTCAWISYNPNFEPKPAYIEYVDADEKELGLLKDECMKFVTELKLLCTEILNK